MTAAICDFCSSPDVRWAFPARDFSTVIAGVSAKEVRTASLNSAGGWAACPACHALILRGDRDRLARRSAKRLIRQHPEMSMRMVLAACRRIHDDFWSQREGAPIPTTPDQGDPTT